MQKYINSKVTSLTKLVHLHVGQPPLLPRSAPQTNLNHCRADLLTENQDEPHLLER